MTAYFNGQNIVIPGAYSVLQADQLQGVGLQAMSNISAIGACRGAKPNQVYVFTNAVDAKQTLRAGALLRALQLMFLNGAYRVYAMRAGNPTQAHIHLQSADPADLLTITSIGYGTFANSIEVKVEAGSTGKKITIKVPNDYYSIGATGSVYETYDNLTSVAVAVAAINAASTSVTAALVLEGTMATAAYAPLANGTDDDAPSNQEYSDAIDLFIQNDDVHVMHLAEVTDAAVHALLDAHCVAATAQRRERIAVVGGASGESAAQIIARAASLNSKRTILCGPGVYLYDSSGNVTLYSPAALAAIVAGMIVSKDVATSITHRTFQCSALETKFTLAEQESLLRGGVCIAEEITINGATLRRIVQGITTYITDDVWEEITIVRICDFLAKNMRDSLEEKYIGKKATSATIELMKSDVITVLQEALSGTDPDAALITGYKNISITVDAQDPRIVNVSFQVSPVYSITWILITAKLRPVLAPISAIG